jgi:hypothetical protein
MSVACGSGEKRHFVMAGTAQERQQPLMFGPTGDDGPGNPAARVSDMNAMIHIHGPHDGQFIVQFLTADGRSLSILVPEEKGAVLGDVQERMPYGLAVHDIVETVPAEGEPEIRNAQESRK